MSDMEVWKPVPGYEGHYSVSNLGRVRSESRTITLKNGRSRRWPESILKPFKNSDGYLRVELWKNNKQQTRFVHRLVLEAFVVEAPPGTQACHWNDTPEDNRLENLRWGTKSENTLDSVRNGSHHEAIKTHGDMSSPPKTHCLNRGKKAGSAEHAKTPGIGQKGEE